MGALVRQVEQSFFSGPLSAYQEMGDLKEVRVRVKVWIEVDGRDLLGPGGYDILKAIKEEGSMLRASKRLGMTYKFMWRYVKRMEHVASKRLFQPWRGGANYGGTRLTDKGLKLLLLYEEMMGEARAFEEKYTKAVRELLLNGE